jgi:hypothetical protein
LGFSLSAEESPRRGAYPETFSELETADVVAGALADYDPTVSNSVSVDS